jgi:hypothetical protein
MAGAKKEAIRINDLAFAKMRQKIFCFCYAQFLFCE